MKTAKILLISIIAVSAIWWSFLRNVPETTLTVLYPPELEGGTLLVGTERTKAILPPLNLKDQNERLSSQTPLSYNKTQDKTKANLKRHLKVTLLYKDPVSKDDREAVFQFEPFIGENWNGEKRWTSLDISLLAWQEQLIPEIKVGGFDSKRYYPKGLEEEGQKAHEAKRREEMRREAEILAPPPSLPAYLPKPKPETVTRVEPRKIRCFFYNEKFSGMTVFVRNSRGAETSGTFRLIKSKNYYKAQAIEFNSPGGLMQGDGYQVRIVLADGQEIKFERTTSVGSSNKIKLGFRISTCESSLPIFHVHGEGHHHDLSGNIWPVYKKTKYQNCNE